MKWIPPHNDKSTVSLIIILKSVLCVSLIQGERLKKLNITVGNTGTENECGYFGRTAGTSDQILIPCAKGAVGRYVMATIYSNPGMVDILNICEIQVFVK